MILTGDIASPDYASSEWLKSFLDNYPGIFDGKRIVCNFEGLVYDGEIPDVNKPVLFNHPRVLDALNRGCTPVLCLANNHVPDFPGVFASTVELLKNKEIGYAGAGSSHAEAEKPLFFTDEGREIILFNACWDFLLYNHKNPSEGIYVAEIQEKKLLEDVEKLHSGHPGASIVIFFHWNLDLETLPFPMYRSFSRRLIDSGASLVAGSHSHCVQGGEKYRDGYIIYGLGNFFIPHNRFIKGKLSYPGFASTELALEWNPETNEAVCHWFKYDQSGLDPKVEYMGSDRFEESERLKEFSPFIGMTNKEYLRYFIKYRRKRYLIPVFRDYHQKRLNHNYTLFLKNRARVAHLLAKCKVIKWQR